MPASCSQCFLWLLESVKAIQLFKMRINSRESAVGSSLHWQRGGTRGSNRPFPSLTFVKAATNEGNSGDDTGMVQASPAAVPQPMSGAGKEELSFCIPSLCVLLAEVTPWDSDPAGSDWRPTSLSHNPPKQPRLLAWLGFEVMTSIQEAPV